MTKQNIGRFERLLLSTHREGIENLIGFIRQSDFYTAPASTRFHSCHEGGLLEHSLNVYDRLVEKFKDKLWKEKVDISEDSIIIAALLHDLTKANFYGTEIRNKKVYSENGLKSDSNGRFDWVSAPVYIVNDTEHPLGHGEGSVIMAMSFIKLKPIELYMIRFHMLFSEPKELYNTIGSAIKKYPAILAMSEADLESTYLLEKEE